MKRLIRLIWKDFKKPILIISLVIVLFLVLAIANWLSGGVKDKSFINSEGLAVGIEEVIDKTESEIPERPSAPKPSPNAVFENKVNDALYEYYPLSIGTK